ncbi:HAMP domain-containing sensor histidine kinase [Brevibacillus sp. FSL K6-6036]|uniref:HAMP domain-containing sensor histidine kinase n=1 Tax=Brevibacillus sp. FSL K6-6036 TaxID=2954682 RepID=UPI0030D46D33
MKFRNSLLFKYLLIVLLAILLLPILFPLLSIALNTVLLGDDEPNMYRNGVWLEQMWHQEAKQLAGADDEAISRRLTELKEKYEQASVFWVDAQGKTRLALPKDLGIPNQWTPSYTIQFMKEHYDADPFTTVAFIGNSRDKGFMVFQVDRSVIQTSSEQLSEKRDHLFIAVALVILCLFLFISWIFIYRLRKRLLGLEVAMTSPTENGIPKSIEVNNPDEIGRLEQAFNAMIRQLELGRKREQEEEQLRRQLIANLSHDLRTPLTSIRSHAYSLKQENLSEQGMQSVELIDHKIGYLAELIDNLLSYTLLSAGKYPYRPEPTDMVRLLRTILAHWYPAFERKGFTVELELPESAVVYRVDPMWIERILDNLLQNVLRHARTGRYLSVRLEPEGGQAAIRLEDRGPGMNGKSLNQGAGIGLTIVQLMLKEMQLKWEVKSDCGGTRMAIAGLRLNEI